MLYLGIIVCVLLAVLIAYGLRGELFALWRDVRGAVELHFRISDNVYPSGSNTRGPRILMGTAVLAAGSFDQVLADATYAINGNARAFVTRYAAGGAIGDLTAKWDVGTATLQLRSANAGDTSTLQWLLITNP